MNKPILADLFCGAGGAARGYQQAGFYVVGFDIVPQPHYCGDEFVQQDALTVHLSHFDAVHASPPCQGFTDLRTMWPERRYDDLLTPTRGLVVASGNPYVIENVEGAPMVGCYVTLCGTMFGLGVGDAELWRHRRFELGGFWVLNSRCAHRRRPRVIGVYGGHGRDRRRVTTITGHPGGRSARDGTQQFSVAERRLAMGIDWMTGEELSQAIPPAYTFHIGQRLMEVLR